MRSPSEVVSLCVIECEWERKNGFNFASPVFEKKILQEGAEKIKPSQPAIVRPSLVVELRISTLDVTLLIDVQIQMNFY